MNESIQISMEYFTNPYGYIYEIRNKINGKRYIGQTTRKNGFRCHWKLNTLLKNYEGSIHLYNSIKKYGIENFERKIIDRALSKEELNEKEEYHIQKYNTLNFNYGYNLRHGGTSGKITDEIKKKMSEGVKRFFLNEENRKKQRDRVRRGENHPFFGKHHSEETKKKISNKLKGTHISEEIKQKISKNSKGKSKSEETKKRMSNAQKGKPHFWSKGKRFSEEHKQKISQAKKGKCRSNETKEKISMILKKYYEEYNKKYNFTREYLYEQYNVLEKSMDQIAKENNCTHKLIKKNLIKYGIEIRNKPSKKTKEKISNSLKGKRRGKENMLYGKHLSDEHRKKISDSLKGKKQGKENPNNKFFFIKEYLNEQYWNLKKTTIEIGKENNCSGSVIQYWMKKYNIYKRSKSETKKLLDEKRKSDLNNGKNS